MQSPFQWGARLLAFVVALAAADAAIAGTPRYYLTDLFNTSAVYEVDSDGVTRKVRNVDMPTGIAIDRRGYLYVASWGDDDVQVLRPDGTRVITYGPFPSPTSVALDTAGNLYVLSANAPGPVVDRVTPDGQRTRWSVAAATAEVLAVDAAGDVYVATNSVVSRFAPDGTPKGIYATSVGSWIQGMAFDAGGDLFLSSYNTNEVNRVRPDGTVTTFFAGAPLDTPVGIGFDAVGNLIVANQHGPDAIDSISPDGKLTPVLVQSWTTSFRPYGLAVVVPEPSQVICLLAAAPALMRRRHRH
jgi:sugar lactone lactonase YvrE